MARRFFYVCAGLLCFTMHASLLEAQPPTNPVVAAAYDTSHRWMFVYTTDGNVYADVAGDGSAWLPRGDVGDVQDVVAASFDPVNGWMYAYTASGSVYADTVGDGSGWAHRGEVGSISPVVAAAYDHARRWMFVYTANGDLYSDSVGDGSAWIWRANVFGGATPTNRDTWGGVKERFRR